MTFCSSKLLEWWRHACTPKLQRAFPGNYPSDLRRWVHNQLKFPHASPIDSSQQYYSAFQYVDLPGVLT
ncbi:hypothetical protein LSAT2_003179 [Lamellibrachia satsuma]|nr:hypothetical protein LSAT2_003179 [Lamellibrachia satsuma]